MSKNTGSSPIKLNTENILKEEGILNNNEEFETVYLADDEIERFMERYLAENPGAEIETRYVKPPPIQLVQDVHVRWLRPPTPEMPPIIIREVGVQQRELPPLRIVEKPKKVKELEPIIIRERPPPLPIEEPTIAYVQNVIKIENKPSIQQSGSKSQNAFQSSISSSISQEIPVEFVSSKNLADYNAGEHTSIFETNSRLSETGGNILVEPISTTSSNDRELIEFEERLKQKLEQQRLLSEERHSLSKKNSITSSKISQGNLPLAPSSSKPTEEHQIVRLNSDKLEAFQEDHKSQLYTTSEELRTTSNTSSRLRPSLPSSAMTQPDRKTSSSVITNVTRNTALSNTINTKPKSDTSTYKNIKFTKITDPDELNRFYSILENPNTPFIKNKKEGDRIMASFDLTDSFRSISNKSNNSIKTNSISDRLNSNNHFNLSNNKSSYSEKLENKKTQENFNLQNTTHLSASSFNANIVSNSTLNVPPPATSTSTENSNIKKTDNFLKLDSSSRQFDSTPSPIVPSITTDYLLNKPKNEFVRLRYVEDLRIISTPSKTEKKLTGPNQQNYHHHFNNAHCNKNLNPHETQTSQSRAHSHQSSSRVHSQPSHLNITENLNRHSSITSVQFSNNSRKNTLNN